MDQALIPSNTSLAQQPTVISVVILDSSHSMADYGDVPRVAVEGHFTTLRQDRSRKHLCAVVGFSDTSYVVIPLSSLDVIGGMEDYKPNGLTLLWETVGATILQLREFLGKLGASTRAQVEVVVGVFSDGRDNRSHPGYEKELQRLSEQALADGWTLMTFGIGIDAARLAEDMGFPMDPDHAITVEATAQGVHDATISMTQTTMGGFRPRTHQQPGS